MRTALLSAALLTSSAAFSAIPVDGWYASVFGGYSYLPDNVSTAKYGLFYSDASYTSGFNAGGRIGYKSSPLRYEAELSYIEADTRKFDVNFVPQNGVSGEAVATALMANVYYDFPEIVPAIEPYLGAGLGYAWVETTLKSSGPFGPNRFKDSNNVFAYQATAGLTYNFAENYSVDAGYRYFATQRVSAFNKTFQAHLASVGVTYRFDVANYK